ncbi:hypothetical protein EJ05DRAFT_99048 [Pseudovirgaria hyperparasitica]|uniref:FZ domain-containing protein n=1 Tax=Pseudovirgaria hyperparasitica TaxID=470096 RepID=A0A6A6W096_9PEZI|nr:uncharacterized protein EJ05DRAFT_99048 [Pseudovirgaria hyperparasitica]KAF2755350.1 hypothetical protein EJ05DRAFT_99048 [Pseudovirgaria hyperparasitica]
MQFIYLTSLRARRSAVLTQLALLLMMCAPITQAQFAYAAELDSILNQDHNHHRIAEPQLNLQGDGVEVGDKSNDMYEAEFLGLNRWITGRQDKRQASGLTNNLGYDTSVEPGSSIFFQFGTAEAEASDVYVTVNTCSQPVANSTSSAEAPQLTLYLSTDESNTTPGPTNTANSEMRAFDQGFVSYNVSSQKIVYIGISAPERPDGMEGGYTVSVGASRDAPYHSWSDQEYPWAVMDTDSKAALFITNTTDVADWRQFEDGNPPYTVYPMPSNSSLVTGMEKSYCAIRDASIKTLNLNITTATTFRGSKNRTPQQQVFVQGLNSSSSFVGYWARKGNSQSDDVAVPVIGGGGTVWPSKTFETKPDGNCQIIFGLSFCSEVAYAVPTNPNSFNATSLAQLYDDTAKNLYTGFNYSLQQTPCEARVTDQYSLARNCTDCANDYKHWLCAVTIPRCYDLYSSIGFLQPRSLGYNFFNGTPIAADSPYSNQTLKDRIATNSSRNAMIDDQIKPGPYKELLPCRDLCYALVRSCPAKMGFGCPTEGKMMSQSYGLDDQCNDPLSIFVLNSGIELHAKTVTALASTLITTALIFCI